MRTATTMMPVYNTLHVKLPFGLMHVSTSATTPGVVQYVVSQR